MNTQMKMSLAVLVLVLAISGTPVGAQAPDELIAINQAIKTAVNDHNLDAFLSYLTDDAIFDLVPMPVPLAGKEQIRTYMQGEFVSFPDWQATEGHVWEGPGIVVKETTISCTHLAEWNGIPPTGNAVLLDALEIIDFEGDKAHRITMHLDVTAQMVQLGVVAPGAGPVSMPSFDLPASEPTGLAPLEAVAEAKRRWNEHDFIGYAQMFRADAGCFVPALGGHIDLTVWLAKSEEDVATFPDIRVDTTRTVDLGNGWVLLEGVVRGTHTAWGAGLPPSGADIVMRTAMLYQIDDQGLIQSMSFYYDNLGVMSQIVPKCPIPPEVSDDYVQDEITSPALQDNPLGDPSTRPLLIYLPPSYANEPERRYPTIYLLHAFPADHRCFTSGGFYNLLSQTLTGIDLGVDVADIAGELMAAGRIGEAIIVMPNAVNALGGSWYERSSLIGDYRSYVARDLVTYIDSAYRTIIDPNQRAIAGHSMGGYGALSLALEYPEVFGAVAALGPGSADLQAQPNWADLFLAEYPIVSGLPQMGLAREDRWNMFFGSFMANAFYSMAAAWTPNSSKPPFYVELPVTYPEKGLVNEVWDRWQQRDLVHQIDRNGANLIQTPVMVIEGRGPTVLFPEVMGIGGLVQALYAQGIPYTYATVPGDHISHLREELVLALEFLYRHIRSLPVIP